MERFLGPDHMAMIFLPKFDSPPRWNDLAHAVGQGITRKQAGSQIMTDTTPFEIGRKLLGFADDWMEKASAIAMSHYTSFNADSGVMKKSDDTPLTRADLEVDAFIGAALASAFPDIPVVTEERAASHDLDVSGTSFFLVDPIDGTREFINKRDEFTVNIALVHDGAPIAGIVAAPALGAVYCGLVGDGVWLDIQGEGRKPIAVGKPDNEALMVVASRSHLSEETSAFIAANKVANTRNAGSSLKFCLLARGDADLYPRFGPTMEWDTAAGHAVLLAAGGFVNTLDGKPLTYGKAEFRNPWFMAGACGVEYSEG